MAHFDEVSDEVCDEGAGIGHLGTSSLLDGRAHLQGGASRLGRMEADNAAQSGNVEACERRSRSDWAFTPAALTH